ncbi:MAG: sulfotransferase family protein, partial [Actinomycetota bacterium]|nr:sulfotransferase family protein [Actinomycetota bacterium]
MALRVVGAGVGRTGTTSLQLALEELLGARCYHMMEVFPQPGHVEAWHQAVKGNLPEWDQLLAGYGAAVDWPVSGFWRELSVAYPDAVVVLSVRESPEVWWKSASQTILHVTERRPP